LSANGCKETEGSHMEEEFDVESHEMEFPELKQEMVIAQKRSNNFVQIKGMFIYIC
jgi:hypothetical protein